MIEVKVGNMLDHLFSLDGIDQPCEFFVHGCNAQGAMGRGIAGEIRSRAPSVYQAYRMHYLLNGLAVGDVIAASPINSDCIIFNAVTQEFYGANPNVRYVDYDGIRICFRKINSAMWDYMKEESPLHVPVLNFPLIGAGLANGDWNIIQSIIDEEVNDRIKKVLWKLPGV